MKCFISSFQSPEVFRQIECWLLTTFPSSPSLISGFRLPFRFLHPFLIPTFFHLLGHNPLQHLTDEPDEVVSSQRILPLPLGAFAGFVLQGLDVADFLGAETEILDDGKEVEHDLPDRIAVNAAAEDGDDFFREVGEAGTGAVGDGMGLESVEFVEGAVVVGIGDEVVDVFGAGGFAGGLVDERGGFGEGVVGFAD